MVKYIKYNIHYISKLTILTILNYFCGETMNKLNKIRGGVHIAVQGYEVDRITEVPIKRRAEKVYLICMPDEEDSERGKAFKNMIKERFEKNKIDYEILEANIFNLDEIVKKIKYAINKERKEFEEVKFYINVSSGSTIGCIAGITCAMILNRENSKIIPYYVIPKKLLDSLSDEECEKLREEYKYLPRSFGVKDVVLIYPFNISLPKEELLIFLKFINRAGDRGLTIKELSILTREEFLDVNLNNEESIMRLIKAVEHIDSDPSRIRIKRYRRTIQKLLEIVEDDKEELNKIVNWRNRTKFSENKTPQSDLVWVNKNVIEKLKEFELIVDEKIGRSRYIKVNEKGKMLLNYI